MHRHRSHGTGIAVLALVVLLGACQLDPTGGHRPPGPGDAVPAFDGRSRAVVRSDVVHSWRQGCPLSWTALSVLTISYWGFDGRRHEGDLVVRTTVAGAVLQVFEGLYRQRFQIHRIHPVDAYGADDERSMTADNTSAFNCRRVPGSTSWSEHSYGTAIDVNPMENPYVVGGTYDPPGSEAFADRARVVPGMAVEGGPLVGAFDAVSWGWGGRWHSKQDYQHFSLTGR